MGLCTNIENWTMPAAISMATEGVRARYNLGAGAGGGGFGAADREIGSKLDAGKVLAAIGQVEKDHQHLSDWVMFAYASPNWNKRSNLTRLTETVLHDWISELSCQGVFVQEKTYLRMNAIFPLIAGGLALEQISGANVVESVQGLKYHPVCSRSVLINKLVEFDVAGEPVEDIPKSMKKRTRYYQNNWVSWERYIGVILNLLLGYDSLAQKLFKKELESTNMAN